MWPWSSKEEKEERQRRKSHQKAKQLISAAEEGDMATVHKLLEKRSAFDVDAHSEEGSRSLYIAASNGHAEVVKLLLRTNAAVDLADWNRNRHTPLYVAASNGHAEVVELLLKANATVDLADWNQNTPLYIAASNGHAEVVKLLLKSNATVDVVDKYGQSPLYVAATYGHAEVVDLLVKSNATVDMADWDGRSPLHISSSTGDGEVVDLLLKANAAVNTPINEIGDTPLHIAASKGYDDVVKLLLKARATVNAINKRAETPVHQACASKKHDVVRLLLMSGASVHMKDKDGLTPLHRLMIRMHGRAVIPETLDAIQVLVSCGATWDVQCDEIVAAGKAWVEAPALKLCQSHWTQEHADGLPLTNIPIEVVKRGAQSTQAYIDGLKSSREVVFRRKICLVGPSFAGKTSFVKSLTTKTPQLEHFDDRTIGIDHFPLRFEQYVASRNDTKVHEATFWDFAGQDAYQVAHSLFFSPRTLFLVCVDLEAFTVAFFQASIMSNMKKQEIQLIDEFVERTVMQWIRMIVARQPDAEFVFIATKEDLLKANTVTERLLKDALVAKLKNVEASTQEMRSKLQVNKPSQGGNPMSYNGPNTMFVSCISSESVQVARAMVEGLISKSDRSFQMPEVYTQALNTIVEMRTDAKSRDITTRIDRVFAPVDTLPAKLKLDRELCRIILQTLHDLGDVLWYEDLGVKLFQDKVILDPLLLIDFIRQVINHNYTGQTMSHTNLKALPYWNGLTNKEQMKAMKQILQKFHLVYATNEDRTMSWDSDLIVPAYWQTKTPAAWLWLGDILRINPSKIGTSRERLSLSDILGVNLTKPQDGEAVRVHWEFHFEFGLPSSLFDQVVVASVSPFFTFDAGPDWIVYEEEDVTACRLMVGRDPNSLHRTMHIEALVAEVASHSQVEELWDSFERLVGAFMGVMNEHPGLDASSFAWDCAQKKIGLERLIQASTTTAKAVRWMPPAKHWTSIQTTMWQRMNHDD